LPGFFPIFRAAGCRVKMILSKSIQACKTILVREYQSSMAEYASNREKWLIILLVIIVVLVIVSSIAIYGPHWIKGVSAFI
jgi:hypothetical protein